MIFDTFISQAWADHADHAAGVAQRLRHEGVAALAEPAQILPLAHLAHHVYGAHLGQWQDGIDFLQGLTHLPACPADEASLAAVRRFCASLVLASGAGDERSTLAPSEAIRLGALAAATLTEHDTPRAMVLLQEALAQAETAALPAADPCNRALAVAGNNLASTLEEKSVRSDAERDLMILAAQTGRRFWALAGGWLEIERAEYRLAMTWLKAGDAVRARQHAQWCLQIVADNAAPALERFFGNEALGLAEKAAGNQAGHAQALQQAQAAFAALEPGDQGWCRASLDKLA